MSDFAVTGVFLSTAAIQNILNSPSGPVGRPIRDMCRDTAIIGQRIAEAELGHHPGDKPRTGQYAKNFVVKNVGGAEYQVVNATPYARILEKGSQPHKIRARRVKFLQFRDRNGYWRIEKAVQHFGTHGYRVLWRATEEALSKSTRINRV